jgi:hypothetical protein
VTCRPGTSVLVLVIENLFCPHTPRPADEDGLPTSSIELTSARAKAIVTMDVAPEKEGLFNEI